MWFASAFFLSALVFQSRFNFSIAASDQPTLSGVTGGSSSDTVLLSLLSEELRTSSLGEAVPDSEPLEGVPPSHEGSRGEDQLFLGLFSSLLRS